MRGRLYIYSSSVLAGAAHSTKMADAELLGKLFDKADKDGDGTLSKSEIQEIFKVFDTAGEWKHESQRDTMV